MTPQKPPFIYKLLPAMLIITLSAVLFFVLSSISGNTLPGVGAFNEMIADYKKEYDEIKKFARHIENVLSQQQKGNNKRRRLSKARQGIEKPLVGSLAKTPRVILDFSNLDSFPKLQVNKSHGAQVSFVIAQKERNGRAAMAARLMIEDIGETKNRRPYGGGDTFFEVPVQVDGMQAVEVTAMGEGVKGFGVAIFSDKNNGWLRWDLGSIELSEEGWSTFLIPFVDFNLWRYDTKKRMYRGHNTWANPKAIARIQIYMFHYDLVDGKSGTLWVDKVALR